MQSHGLLTDHNLELINSGPTGYHKNQLILGYIKLMDDTSLGIFSKLLRKSHPGINIPTEIGESIHGLHELSGLPCSYFSVYVLIYGTYSVQYIFLHGYPQLGNLQLVASFACITKFGCTDSTTYPSERLW